MMAMEQTDVPRVMLMADVARLLGVTKETLETYRRRYAHTHPTPKPDTSPDARTPAWLGERRVEWLEWFVTRPRGRRANEQRDAP